jgi:hypothetical protein
MKQNYDTFLALRKLNRIKVPQEPKMNQLIRELNRIKVPRTTGKRWNQYKPKNIMDILKIYSGRPLPRMSYTNKILLENSTKHVLNDRRYSKTNKSIATNIRLRLRGIK